MKVVIACGGTGGHLFPGVAVAETLLARQHRVRLLVSEKSVDQSALRALIGNCNRSAVSVQAVSAVGYSGVSRLIGFCSRLVRALGDCARVCDEFEPDAVLGMGGFTSAPAVLAARRRRGTATLIHESNAVPGKANRWAGRVADHVAVGLTDCVRFFGRKPVTVTGTPIRAALRGGRVPAAHERLGLDAGRATVLVMGGSQGARAINQAMAEALPWLGDWKETTQFVHLSGPRDEQAVRAVYERNGFEANVMSFCSQMELAYSAADVVVARAGAATLTELSAFGLPAVLIPFAQAAGNHQWHNARVFERTGAGRLLGQSELTGTRLASLIDDMLANAAVRNQMARAARALAVEDAAERIADLVEEYAE